MPVLEAVQPEPLPIAETAGLVLLLSIAATAVWLLYLIR